MNKILVSIIVPIYNKEIEIEKCVNSLVNQTHSSIEILLVDDGSKDLTYGKITELALADTRIRSYTKKNGGVSDARNYGIDRAIGEYIMFVDPDDTVDEKIVEILLKTAVSQKANITMCSATVFENGTEIVNPFFNTKEEVEIIDKHRAIAQLYSDNYYNDSGKYNNAGVVWAKLYSHKFLKENQLKFKIDLRRMQDNDFNLEAFYFANKLVYVDLPLYNYDFEHIASASRKYVKDAEEIYINKARYGMVFFDKYYKQDKIMKQLLARNLLMYLIGMMTNFTCHPNANINNKQRINKLRWYCEETVFSNIFTDVKPETNSFQEKILYTLLRKKNYHLVVLIYKIAFTFNM